jgi:hemolysin III
VKDRKETIPEEIANSITHGIGAGMAIAALVLLIVFSALKGSAWHVVSFSIYGASLVLLYISSTLMHAIQHTKVKNLFQIFDHCTIYLLIAGTYTPFTLVALHGAFGWTLFGIVWGLAILGIVFKSVFSKKFVKGGIIISTVFYIIMGWIVVIGMDKVIANIEPAGVWWLIAGGLSYTFGVIFFLWRKMPFSHAIWHLFVIGGSVCHFFSVILYVLPIKV